VKRLLVPGLALVALACFSCPAAADSNIGFRAGFSVNPDDFIAGVHFRTDALTEDLYFVPSLEVGFGDATMFAFNADLHYVFETSSKLHPYAGGGMTVNWFDEDGSSDTEVGGSFLGGVILGETKMGPMFFEAKLGLGDVPDAKFLVGWNLR
jgi:hypothetical protein